MNYSEETIRKVRLYYACNFLFNQGKSHPQIVEILTAYEDDPNLIKEMADAAQFDKWRTVFNTVQQLTAEGLSYDQILNRVRPMEKDPEIVAFICNSWYQFSIAYMDNFLEANDNIFEGSKWVILSAFLLAFLFVIGSSLLSKIFWSIFLFIAIATWIHGMQQKKLALRLQQILHYDFNKFDTLI